MNYNFRPILCYNPNPKLQWNKVSNAVSYQFKLIDKATSTELWQIEVTDAESKNEVCYCNYPQEKQVLEPSVSYQFIAEALNNEECLSRFETEVILLKEEEQKACQEFEEAIYKLEGMEELKQMWFVSMKSVFGNGDRPPVGIPLTGSYIGCSL